jgi:NAD(P)-dependent dehydrogenase (short-subunit alcohol dehydrogenase family)
MRLKGKKAVVTGGAMGIGRAIALAFAAEGAVVAVVDFNGEAATETAALINESGGDAFVLTADIGNSGQVAAMAEAVEARFGAIDVLANNAGSRIVKPFLEHSEEDWRRMLDVNLTGHFLVCKALVPLMIEAGGGHIVNTCSIASVQGRPNRIGYCAAKGGFLTFTKALAADLSDKNIRVNALAPGMIETPMNQALADDPEVGSAWNNENLVGRWGQPDDVAKAAVFLASSDADFITGSTIQVDGGSISAFVRAGEMAGR